MERVDGANVPELSQKVQRAVSAPAPPAAPPKEVQSNLGFKATAMRVYLCFIPLI